MARFVNSYQTKEERKSKYKLCKEHGASRDEATRYRDWTRGHIERKAIPYLVDRKLRKLTGNEYATES